MHLKLLLSRTSVLKQKRWTDLDNCDTIIFIELCTTTLRSIVVFDGRILSERFSKKIRKSGGDFDRLFY